VFNQMIVEASCRRTLDRLSALMLRSAAANRIRVYFLRIPSIKNSLIASMISHIMK